MDESIAYRIYEPLPEDTRTEQEKLKVLGAPIWVWMDLSDAACCLDGFCKDCASEI